MSNNAYQEIINIVEEAKSKWNYWKMKGEHKQWAHKVWCNYKKIINQATKQQAWSKIATHQRLLQEVINQKDNDSCGSGVCGGCKK